MNRRSRRRRDSRGRDSGGRAARGRPEGRRDALQPAESRRVGDEAGRGPGGGRVRREAAPRPGDAHDPLSRLGVQVILLTAVFVVAVLVAELAGAANLGVSFGVGQLAFAIALVYLLLRR